MTNTDEGFDNVKHEPESTDRRRGDHHRRRVCTSQTRTRRINADEGFETVEPEPERSMQTRWGNMFGTDMLGKRNPIRHVGETYSDQTCGGNTIGSDIVVNTLGSDI